MTIQEAIQQLGRLYETGRRYRMVEQSYRVLAQLPDCPELAWLVVRALAELGQGEVLQEFLRSRRDLGASAGQMRELEASLANLPGGMADWQACEAHFRQNVEVIEECRPELREWARAAGDLLGGVDLHQTIQGQWLISRREADGSRQWLGDLTTIEEEAGIEVPPRGQLGASGMIGTRVGRLIDEVYERTHRVLLNFSHPLYVVEPVPLRFAAWLYCGDHRRLLGDPRVHYFVGDDGAEQFAALMRGNCRLLLPEYVLNFSPELEVGGRFGQIIQAIGQERNDELARLTDELERRYRDRDTAYWLERLQPPGKILGLTSRYTTVLQYAMRDTMAAFEALGYEAETVIEEADHEVLSKLEICRRILDADPAMLMYLDHLRYEYEYLPENIPFMCWIQDPLPNLLCKEAGASIGPMDFVCGFYRHRLIEEFGYPADQVYTNSMAVSSRVFHDGPISDEDRDRYGCDVCFVSHASKPVADFAREEKAKYPVELHPFLDSLYVQIMKLLEEDGYIDMQTTAEDLVRSVLAEQNFGLDDADIERIKNSYVFRIFDWGRRQQTLEWVADWARKTRRRLKIYGNGWDQHPTLSEFAAGVAGHGDELRRILRASRFSLQLNPSGFRHQRALESLSCGVLPLTRYCPVDFADRSMEEYLEGRRSGQYSEAIASQFPGLERIVFRTSQEFEAMADRFIGDDDYYDATCGGLRRVVMERFTYEAILREVVDAYKGYLQRCSCEVLRRA